MSKRMEIPVEAGVAGKYRIRVGKAGRPPRVDTGWFENLITDAGLNLMGSNSYLDACQVGSGTNTPNVADTSLQSFVAGTNAVTSSVASAQSTAPYYAARTKTFRFGEGAAAGNLSEVGIGTATTGGTLFSRALITDGSGTPTTITVLADEFLDVSYQVQLVPPTSDTVITVTDTGPAGTAHTVTIRASNVTSNSDNTGWNISGTAVRLTSNGGVQAFDGTIGDITTDPAGSMIGSGSDSTDAYANGSLERTGTHSQPLDSGNAVGGIKAFAMAWTSAGAWQAGFDPAILKTSSDVLTMGVKVSWTRTTAL